MWDWCLSEYGEPVIKARVIGNGRQMKSFNFFFGIRLCHLVLSHSDNLNVILQTPKMSAAEAQKLSQRTVGTIVSLPEEAQFNKFWHDTLSEATILELDNPKLPQERKAPQRIEEYFTSNAKPEFHSDIQSHYWQIYYKALDFIISAIQKRFEKADYQIYVSLENLLLKAANKEDFSEEQKVVTEFYDTDFDAQRLKVHLKIFAEYCTLLITKDLGSIIEHLRFFSKIQKSLISEINKLVKLILVIPATNATSEHVFSTYVEIG